MTLPVTLILLGLLLAGLGVVMIRHGRRLLAASRRPAADQSLARST